MSGFLIRNLDIIYFFYSLAFLMLGIVLITQIRAAGKSKYKLLDILWLLALFAIIHGANEFIEMFILVKGNILLLNIFALMFLSISFVFLFAFGYKLINISGRKIGLWFPITITVLFLGFPFIAANRSFTSWNISARYFFGFTGSILSAIGFYLYNLKETKKIEQPVKKYLFIASISFALYGLAAGLIVPKAEFFPASIFNNNSFTTFLGFPPQLLRSLIAISIAWSIWHVVNIFNQEKAKELREAHDELEIKVQQRTKALSASEARYRTLAESAQDPIFIIDSNFKVKYANTFASKQLRLSPKEVVGKQLSDIFPPEVSNQQMKNIQTVFDKNETFHSVSKIFYPPDRWVWMDTLLAPIRDEEGNPISVTGISRDITQELRAKELSDALNAINNAINTSLDFNQIMQTTVNMAAQAIGSEASGILLVEDGKWVVRYIYNLPKNLIGTQFDNARARGAIIAAQAGKAISFNDAYNDKRLDPEIVREYSIRSQLVTPLILRKKVIGAIYFSNHSAPLPFTDQQVDFANKLSTSVSLAIENTRLYESEHNIADTLQEALLTAPKQLPGIDFGYLYRSATEEARVGGDFYDLFELEHNKIGIILGDVSGKGLEAATLTNLVKNTIKAYAHLESSPASIMKKTNEIIVKSSEPRVFVTVFFAILDTKTGKFVYCNAGHPFPVVKKGQSDAYFIKANSTVIGIFEKEDFNEDTDILKREDILILYSDGATEARSDGEFYGDERLINFIKELKHPNVNKLPETIFKEIISFSKGDLFDDVVFLTLSLKQ